MATLTLSDPSFTLTLVADTPMSLVDSTQREKIMAALEAVLGLHQILPLNTLKFNQTSVPNEYLHHIDAVNGQQMRQKVKIPTPPNTDLYFTLNTQGTYWKFSELSPLPLRIREACFALVHAYNMTSFEATGLQ